MAKKRTVNKSKEIRDYTKKHPGKGPTEVANALNERGLDVSPQQVSTTLSNDRKKNGTQPAKSGRKPKKATARSTASVSTEEVMKAKALVKQLGSLEKARKALDAFSQIVD